MTTINVDSFTVFLGLLAIGILNGLGSAIGNIIARRYVEPHINGQDTGKNVT